MVLQVVDCEQDNALSVSEMVRDRYFLGCRRFAPSLACLVASRSNLSPRQAKGP